MKSPVRLALGASLAVLFGVLVWAGFVRTRPEEVDVLSGYIEGEALYLAAPVSGSVVALPVTRGQRVEAAQPLFAVDARSLAAVRAQAQAQLAQARGQAAAAAAAVDQQQAGLTEARAQSDNAARDAARYASVKAEAVSAQEADRSRTQARSAAAQLSGAEQQVRGARAQAEAAKAAVAHAQGALADAEARLDQASARAPGPGRGEEVYVQKGEWAGANQPILSLIPDGKVKLRFYVPERDLGLYQLGRQVDFGCDGCRRGLHARVNYISPRPEFTPPVIYSRESRDRLVFLIEARPDDAAGLTPGLPVDVVPLKAAARP